MSWLALMAVIVALYLLFKVVGVVMKIALWIVVVVPALLVAGDAPRCRAGRFCTPGRTRPARGSHPSPRGGPCGEGAA